MFTKIDSVSDRAPVAFFFFFSFEKGQLYNESEFKQNIGDS